jgi:hypothetical protein
MRIRLGYALVLVLVFAAALVFAVDLAVNALAVNALAANALEVNALEVVAFAAGSTDVAVFATTAAAVVAVVSNFPGAKKEEPLQLWQGLFFCKIRHEVQTDVHKSTVKEMRAE